MHWAPRRKSEGLVIREMGEELLVYDERRGRAFSLNPTAARLFRLADGTKTVEDLAAELNPGTSVKVSKALVKLGLRDLRRHALLEGEVPEAVSQARRQAIRRLATAAMLPVILALDARRTSAQSCFPTLPLHACTLNSECCSGICLISLVCG